MTAVTPAAPEQPGLIIAAVPWSYRRIADASNSVAFYGLLEFGVLFPIVATIYALIVY